MRAASDRREERGRSYSCWRGERTSTDCAVFSRYGLSPLAQGTGWLLQRTCCERSVYPRSRGEQTSELTQLMRGDGLSPLTRGTVPDNNFPVCLLRFIPARAGNGVSPLIASTSCPVYLRSRGEQLTCAAVIGVIAGLSPLARGTVGAAPAPLHSTRFIPARAGNRNLKFGWIPVPTVYPRSRGEQVHLPI